MRFWMNALCASCAALTVFLTGCATETARRSPNVSLKSLAPIEAREFQDADAPAQPVSGLPPPPAAGAEYVWDGGGSGLTIQQDCLVHITVGEDPSLTGSYPVNELGAVQFGYIGPVILFNKTEYEAEQKISEVLRMRNFRKATVKVKILRASYDKIRVTGEVGQPGLIRIGAGDSISLNDALLRAGGPKVIENIVVKVVRGGLLNAVAGAASGEEYNLVTEDGKPKVPDVQLRNNDVVFVYGGGSSLGDGGKEILVLGEVTKPGVYEFAPGEPSTMMHLIFKLGGLPRYANEERIRVLRRRQDGYDEEIQVNASRILKEGNPDLDVVLQDGDRVIVSPRRIALF